MTLLTPHLTKPQGDTLAALQEASVPGMAHWAGTGPVEATCRTCAFWGHEESQFKREDGWLLPKRCSKFSRMMQGLAGPGVPFDTSACRYYEHREKSPPVKLPKRTKAEAEA